MIVSIFFACVCFALGFFINRPDTFVTLSGWDYQVYTSIFTLLGCIFVLVFFWKFLLFPFRLFAYWGKNRQQKKEQKKQDYLASIIQTIVNNNTEVYPLLVKRLPKFLDKDNALYWSILALLKPDEQVYQKLLSFPETALGGIHGFLHIAENQGNLEQIHQLLDSATENQKKVRWVQQSYMQLYIMENNWTEALNTLENLRKTMPKKEYISNKACLLLLCGETEKAYKLDPEQTAIALAYAKSTPKKAVKILQRLWKTTPCWEVYTAYKEAIQSENPKKQKKMIYKLIQMNPGNRFSVLAKADFALMNNEYVKANETLKVYLENYTMTNQVAMMLAHIEREANHNEQNALVWEQKAGEIQDKTGWACLNCSYTSNNWEAVCPACHMFNKFIPN